MAGQTFHILLTIKRPPFILMVLWFILILFPTEICVEEGCLQLVYNLLNI